MPEVVLHVAERAEWERAGETYAPPSLAREGFVHCSTRAQLARTIALYYAGRGREIVILVIDAAALGDALRWEPPAGAGIRAAGELFPHVYRAIPRSAVLAVETVP